MSAEDIIYHADTEKSAQHPPSNCRRVLCHSVKGAKLLLLSVGILVRAVVGLGLIGGSGSTAASAIAIIVRIAAAIAVLKIAAIVLVAIIIVMAESAAARMIFIKEILSSKIDERCSTDDSCYDNNSLYGTGFLLGFLLTNARDVHYYILLKIFIIK